MSKRNQGKGNEYTIVDEGGGGRLLFCVFVGGSEVVSGCDKLCCSIYPSSLLIART